MKTVSAGKKIVNKLVEECTANIFEVKIAEKTLTENTRECSSSTLYSSSTIFTIKIRTATFFVYYKYMNHNKKDCLKIWLCLSSKNLLIKMGNIKPINTENWTYYFFKDLINIKDFKNFTKNI